MERQNIDVLQRLVWLSFGEKHEDKYSRQQRQYYAKNYPKILHVASDNPGMLW